MSISRRHINGIFAVIVIVLAAVAGISLYNKSGKSVVRETSVKENAGETLPDNHPPEEIAKRLAALIRMNAEDPQNADILSEIGNTYYDLGEYASASDYYRKSLEIRPDNPYVETDLATCLHYLNRDDEALIILDKVLKYRPNFPSALYNKGVVLIHGKKDPGRGIVVWEELLKQDLDPARRAEIEHGIQEYKSSVR